MSAATSMFDCHTHWAPCFQNRDGRNPASWIELIRGAGVTHAVILPFTGLIHDGKVAQDNDDLAAVCAHPAAEGRMIPFCTAQISIPDEALAEIRRALGVLKMRGIKFHPWLQGLSPGWAAMDDVCDLAEEFDVPILFHDGTPPFSLPAQMALLAKRHPRVQIILGHTGLFEHWREAIAAVNLTPNLWPCLCSPHVAALKEIVRRCDPQRLLWGSDHGFTLDNFYPYRVGLMDLLGMSDNQREAMFSTNPRRLLKM